MPHTLSSQSKIKFLKLSFNKLMVMNMLSNLAMLRKSRKMSQKELAEQFNINQNTVSRWENGDRQIDLVTLKALADFFNVSIDYLLGVETKNISDKSLPTYSSELLTLFRQMDDTSKLRLIGAAYVILAEQKQKTKL